MVRSRPLFFSATVPAAIHYWGTPVVLASTLNEDRAYAREVGYAAEADDHDAGNVQD
jgi:hypothetical protein